MDIAVSVRNITKKYRLYKDKWGPIKEVFSRNKLHKEFFAIKDITLNFPKGEAIGVLGKNGSGKSTLLKIITGITEPTDGDVYVNGSLVFLDVSSGIDSELSGYENIFMKGTLLGYSRQEMMQKVEDIIEFSELGEYIYQPVKNYSSGMRSKLGFAISVNVDPEILIVDEALAVGDSQFREKCMNKMNDFKKQGKTIIFVSHDKHAVESFCSKAAWIHQGELITYGDSKFVAAIYNDFMVGNQSIESIRTEVEYNHSIEKLNLDISEGINMDIEGYIYNQNNKHINTTLQLILEDMRNGRTLIKPVSSTTSRKSGDLVRDNWFSVQFSENDNPLFFKPGKYKFKVKFKNDEQNSIEFPLWAGNVKIEQPEEDVGRFKSQIIKEKDYLYLLLENRDNVEEQVNKIWFEKKLLKIEGVAFVRGYETKEVSDVHMEFNVINLEDFTQHSFPVEITGTEEITENPAFNPQGKVYNFSKFNISIDLEKLTQGIYECQFTYKMNKEPSYELINLVWASKKESYTEKYIFDNKTINVKTETKYLRLEVSER